MGTALEEAVAGLLTGSLLADASWPLLLRVRLCDLRLRFLDKGRAGNGFRAVARNGRVLLCSDRAVNELAGRETWLRLQTWHKIHLPGDKPMPFGILLCTGEADKHRGRSGEMPRFITRLVAVGQSRGELCLDVGGRLSLEFASENRFNFSLTSSPARD
jgi:hypothetical protein